MSLSYSRCSIPLYTKEFQVRVCGHDIRDIKSLFVINRGDAVELSAILNSFIYKGIPSLRTWS